MGHYAGNCPSSTDNAHTGSQSLQVGLTMTQMRTNIPSTDIIDTNWIVLNTCSTIRYIRNRYLIQDICSCDVGEEIQGYNNRGHQDYSYTDTTKMLPFEVFYNKNYLANII